MTCGFQTASGADLDDLFYTDNGNSGALGFCQSDGTDLGNKYTSAATLGYSVGYCNSAGTDLGYLRGDVPPPEVLDCWSSWHPQGEETSDLGDISGTLTSIWGYFEYGGRANTDQGVWDVYPCFTCSYCSDPLSYSPNLTITFKPNSTISIGPVYGWSGSQFDVINGGVNHPLSFPHTYADRDNRPYGAGSTWESDQIRQKVNSNEAAGKFSLGILAGKAERDGVGFTNKGVEWYMTLYHRFQNALGWSSWVVGKERYLIYSNR